MADVVVLQDWPGECEHRSGLSPSVGYPRLLDDETRFFFFSEKYSLIVPTLPHQAGGITATEIGAGSEWDLLITVPAGTKRIRWAAKVTGIGTVYAKRTEVEGVADAETYRHALTAASTSGSPADDLPFWGDWVESYGEPTAGDLPEYIDVDPELVDTEITVQVWLADDVELYALRFDFLRETESFTT